MHDFVFMHPLQFIIVVKPALEIDAVGYRVDNITVTVIWTEAIGVKYDVQILPSVPLRFNGSTSVQIVLLYNTEYTMSIRAVTPCIINSTKSYITLNYSKLYSILNHIHCVC
jgi:hypothetical protein